MRARIAAIAYHLPETVLDNVEFARGHPRFQLDKLKAKTGIDRPHVAAAGETPSDLAVRAAERLFAEADLPRARIDYLPFCIQAPDYLLPTSACLIHRRLGLRSGAGAFDMNLGCSGFVYGLGLAQELIRSGQAARAGGFRGRLLLGGGDASWSLIIIFERGIMATCTICSGQEFQTIASYSMGNWQAGGPDGLIRSALNFEYGECTACRHVMVTTPYDAAIFERLYRDFEPVIWGDEREEVGTPFADMLEYCQPELLAVTAPIVDFGCGNGELLNLLHNSYGRKLKELLGVDFRPRLRPNMPFIEGDLADITALLPANLVIQFGFVSHVLEHLVDPRGLLIGIRRFLAPGAFLYVEVPDNSVLRPNDIGTMPHLLFHGQHIQYFTNSSLARLVMSCGYMIVRQETVNFGHVPRLKMLLQAESKPGPAPILTLHFSGIAARRDRLARSLEDALTIEKRIGLWGLGAEFHQLLEDYDFLRPALSAGRVALFDLEKASMRFADTPIESPSAISALDGPVFLLPMTYDVRRKMQRFAAQQGFPAAQIVDPYIDGSAPFGKSCDAPADRWRRPVAVAPD